MGGSVCFASKAQNSPAISQGSFCTTNWEGSHQYTDTPWRKCLLTVGGWAHRGLPDPGQGGVPRADRPFCNPGHLRSEFSHQVSTAKSRGGEPGAKLSRDTRLRDPLSQPLPPAGPGPPSAPHVTPSPPSSPPARAPRKNQPCVPAPHAGRHCHPAGLAHICVSQPMSSLPPHHCASEPGRHRTSVGQGSGCTPTGVSHPGSAGGKKLVTLGAAPPTA